MMQLELKPASHRNDPSTSFKAEEQMNKGRRQTNAQKVFWLVARYPHRTASEYAHMAITHGSFLSYLVSENGWTYDRILIEVRRRLSDMNGKLVVQGPKRKGRNNTDEVTWRIK